jgi:hypothetical protein
MNKLKVREISLMKLLSFDLLLLNKLSLGHLSEIFVCRINSIVLVLEDSLESLVPSIRFEVLLDHSVVVLLADQQIKLSPLLSINYALFLSGLAESLLLECIFINFGLQLLLFPLLLSLSLVRLPCRLPLLLFSFLLFLHSFLSQVLSEAYIKLDV